MPGPLDDARLSLKWTEEKINDLNSRMSRFVETRPYRIGIDRNEKPGYDIHKVWVTKPLPNEFRGLVKDIAQDLRSPLDYAVCTVAERLAVPGIRADTMSFPIARGDINDFETLMKKGKIDAVSPVLGTIIRAMKPYKGGDNSLFGLHEMNRYNKHLQISTVSTSSIPAGVYIGNMGAGEIIIPNVGWGHGESGTPIYAARKGSIFDLKYTLGFDISVEKPTAFKNTPIVDIFEELGEAITTFLNDVERAFL